MLFIVKDWLLKIGLRLVIEDQRLGNIANPQSLFFNLQN